MYGLDMTWLGDAKRNIVCWASETWREKRRPDWRPVTYCLRGRKKKDTSVAWPVCRAAEKHTEIWGSKPHLQSRSCKTFSKIL